MHYVDPTLDVLDTDYRPDLLSKVAARLRQQWRSTVDPNLVNGTVDPPCFQ